MSDIIYDASLSDCGEYRWWLTRRWNQKSSPLAFLMLNPSTADMMVDDPTIRRCMGFAEGFGYGGIIVINLYGLRSPSPDVLWQHQDPIGSANDNAIRHIVARGHDVVCAWGANAPQQRVDYVLKMMRAKKEPQLYCLGKTKAGAPKHPLYLRRDTALEVYP